MNKKQRKQRLRYLNQRRKENHPKRRLIRESDIKRRKMLGLLLPVSKAPETFDCRTCIYGQPALVKPRGKMHIVCVADNPTYFIPYSQLGCGQHVAAPRPMMGMIPLN